MITKTSQELAYEQEESVIGALLKQPDKIELVKSIVAPDCFFVQRFRWVYESMLSLHERGLHIDAVTVGDELERHGHMQELGGRMALSTLRENNRWDNPESYAVKILDYAAKRELLEQAGVMATWSNNGRDASAIRDDMMKRLSEIRVPNHRASQHTQTMKEALSKNWDTVNNGNPHGVKTGFIDIDQLLDDALYPPDFMVIAGRPGDGKTSLLLSIAKNAAESGKRVAVFSLEMSNEQVVMRIISMETGVPFGAMRRGRMTREQWGKYNSAVEKYENLPLYLNDLPAITISQIQRVLRELQALHGKIDLVLVDYLQLGGADNKHNTREQEVSEVSRGLKAVAKEFDVPVLAAAQLSRAVEQRAEKRPVLSDLRESGSIENDADIVAFIYRPEKYDVNTSKHGIAEIILAKHRNGAVGTVELLFRSALTRFENLATKMFRTEGQ